ncbi:MAG: glycosyltransferase 87 family protein [Pseudobdellovibrionaceae bacterium]
MFKKLFKKNLDILSGVGVLLFLSGLLWNACLHGGDFKVFYLAGDRLLKHVPIYQASDGWSPFKYHPSWAIFFSLWSMLPLTLSLFLFNFSNIIFWFAGAKYWARLLEYELTPSTVFLLLLLSLNALSAETAYGQINGFLFWGATQIFVWMEAEPSKPIRSGILLALLISLKLHFGILLFYLFNKNWRTAGGLLVGGLTLHLFSLLAFKDFGNLVLYRSWMDLLLTQSAEQFNTFEVQSVLRACYVFFGNSMAKIAWAVLLAVFIFFGIYLDRSYFLSLKENKIKKKNAFSGCYWLAVVFFFSPLAWWYQILYLFPLAFLLLKTSPQKVGQILVWTCLLSFAAFSFNTLGRDGIFIFKLYMGYFAAGLTLFGFFLTTLLRKQADQFFGN